MKGDVLKWEHANDEGRPFVGSLSSDTAKGGTVYTSGSRFGLLHGTNGGDDQDEKMTKTSTTACVEQPQDCFTSNGSEDAQSLNCCDPTLIPTTEP